MYVTPTTDAEKKRPVLLFNLTETLLVTKLAKYENTLLDLLGLFVRFVRLRFYTV